MSAQTAMLVGTAGLSAFSAIQGGMAQGQGLAAQAGQARIQGASLEVQGAQNQVAAAQEEIKRRVGLMRLLQANRASLAGRGVSGEQGSSFDVIQDHNVAEAEKDISNIRFMGESKTKMLNFAAQQQDLVSNQYLNMASMARTQGIFNAIRTIGMAGISYFGLPSGGGKPSTTGPFAIGGGHDI